MLLFKLNDRSSLINICLFFLTFISCFSSTLRSHNFDTPGRKKANPKRKSGVISSFGVPGRGAEGARLHHKNNEEKILSHRRFGIPEADVT